MTEKELRKLNRYQLLELLVMQTKRDNELQEKLDALEAQIRERDIRLSEIGSIAEASLQLSGVFEASQKAADLYLATVKKQAAEITEDARRQAASIIRKAEIEAHYLSVLRDKHSEVLMNDWESGLKE